MPILPLIDLLLLLGTGSLFVGFLLKAIALATRLQPTVLGFSSLDFVLVAGICMGLALVLAARTWVKLNEPRLLALHRESLEEQFRREQRLLERARSRSRARCPRSRYSVRAAASGSAGPSASAPSPPRRRGARAAGLVQSRPGTRRSAESAISL